MGPKSPGQSVLSSHPDLQQFLDIRTELRGGSGGQAAKTRKQNESGQGQLAAALTSFQQNSDSELARLLIKILKECLSKGSHEGEVAEKVLSHVQAVRRPEPQRQWRTG